MKKPQISIIIPVYNVEKFLRKCLDSIQCQTFTNWQAICVDDGSVDNSGKILDEYATQDSRFIVIHKKNGGASEARNVGMKKATGKYILFLDSDDFIHPQTMELTYKLAEQYNVDIVTFGYKKVDVGVVINDYDDYSKLRKYSPCDIVFRVTELEHKYSIFQNRWLKHCFSVKQLYRTSLIKDIPFITGIVIEDFPWWATVVSKHPRAIVTRLPLYYYVSNYNSVTYVTKYLIFAKSLSVGGRKVFEVFKNAPKKEYKYIAREMLWPFVIRMYQFAQKITDDSERQEAIEYIKQLVDDGVIEYAPDAHARRYRKRILKFINQNKD